MRNKLVNIGDQDCKRSSLAMTIDHRSTYSLTPIHTPVVIEFTAEDVIGDATFSRLLGPKSSQDMIVGTHGLMTRVCVRAM